MQPTAYGLQPACPVLLPLATEGRRPKDEGRRVRPRHPAPGTRPPAPGTRHPEAEALLDDAMRKTQTLETLDLLHQRRPLDAEQVGRTAAILLGP